MNEKEKKLVSNLKKLKADYPTLEKYLNYIIAIVLMIPILIWLVYLIGHHKTIIPTDITAGELLSFYGTLLSFLGIFCLSALALWQNEKANQMNERLIKLQLEEYTPYLKIFSFAETIPDSKRCPDTSQSVLSRTRGYSSKEITEKYQKDFEEKLKKFTIHNNGCQFDDSEYKEVQLNYIKNMKKVPKTITEKYNDIYWIIDRTSVNPLNQFNSLESLEKLTYRFVFKNESNAKIKKIVINEVHMNNTMFNWVFRPNNSKNYISQVLQNNETINFNINLYWDINDIELSFLMNSSATNITMMFTMITIGNNEQVETVDVNLWAGSMFESSYQLL